MCVCSEWGVKKRKLKSSRAGSVTVPAGYAWIQMRLRRRVEVSLC